MREILLVELFKEILGPRDGIEETLNSPPISEYITGVLAPITDQIVREIDQEVEMPYEDTDFYDEETDMDIVCPPLVSPALYPQNRPPSMGISFEIESTDIPKKGLVSFRGKLVLDYGAGHSIDYKYINKFGGACYLYDLTWFPLSQFAATFPPNHRIHQITPETPRRLFDVILLNYVLNVVTLVERKIIAEMALKLLKPAGKLIVGVRTDSASIKPTWRPFEDGFITPKKTFQSFFDQKYRGFQKIRDLFPRMQLRHIGRGTWLIEFH